MVEIKVSWGRGRWHKVRFGKIIGIHIYEPELGRKYPYVAYDYTETPCAEWDIDRTCKTHVGDLPEGTLLYMENYIQRSRRHGDGATAVGIVKSGATYKRADYWEAINIDKLVEDRDVLLHTVGLTLSARRKGWNIARTTIEQNLMAVWLVDNGYVSETPVRVGGKIAVAMDLL